MAAEKSKLKIARIYADSSGESHFSSFEIGMINNGDIGYLSSIVPSQGIIFRKTPSNYNYTWHTAPRRQFVINLNADVEITVSNGERQVLKQGQIFFLEDITGKGHCSTSVDNKERLSVFLPVKDEFRVDI